MYEQIRKKEQQPGKHKNLALWIGLIFCAVIFLSIIIPVIVGAYAQFHYHKMFQEMAHSSVYSRNHASAWLYVGDEKYFYRADRTSGLFTILADGGSGKPQSDKNLPDDEYVMIDFGDGATLQIWYAKVKGNYGNYLQDGLFISFVNPEGKRMSYTTNMVYVKELIPYLSPEAQDWLDRGIAQMYPDT